MTILTIATPSPAATRTNSASASGAGAGAPDSGDGDLDFAGMLGADIDRAKGPTHPDEPAEPKKDAVIVSGEVLPCDPAALLDAIAAGGAIITAQEPSAAQIALQPMPVSISAVNPSVRSPAAGSAELSVALPASARDGAVTPENRTERRKTTPQSDDIRTATSPRAADVRTDAGPTVTPGKSGAHENASLPAFKSELSEHMQNSGAALSVIGAPGHALPPALQSQSAITAAALVHVEHLAQPFGSPAWNDGMASRVVWMVRNELQSAEIHLNPPDLGPIEVKLVLASDAGIQAASVQFIAAHAATRDAIESALPRLREMLLDSGIALGNTSVDSRTAGNTNGSGDPGRQSQASTQAHSRAGENPESAIQPRPGTLLRHGNGLVDTFA
jgi:flagellar hook-length control protein FliK